MSSRSIGCVFKWCHLVSTYEVTAGCGWRDCFAPFVAAFAHARFCCSYMPVCAVLRGSYCYGCGLSTWIKTVLLLLLLFSISRKTLARFDRQAGLTLPCKELSESYWVFTPTSCMTQHIVNNFSSFFTQNSSKKYNKSNACSPITSMRSANAVPSCMSWTRSLMHSLPCFFFNCALTQHVYAWIWL